MQDMYCRFPFIFCLNIFLPDGTEIRVLSTFFLLQFFFVLFCFVRLTDPFPV
jgi:hypothetical protein